MVAKVAIIVLNWNGWRDTIECLESLYQITYPNYDVIVVDNGSKDESIEKIKEYCEGKIKVESKFFEYNPDNKPIKIMEYTREEAEADEKKERETIDLPPNRKITLIKNEKNYGFVGGNNIAIRHALNNSDPNYILLLNIDTVVDKDFLTKLVSLAESNDKVGFIGPKTYYYDSKGRKDVIYSAGIKLNIRWKCQPYRLNKGEIDKGQSNEIIEADYIEGTCLLVRKELVNKIGLLNPEYGLYYEDIDWCLRGKKIGYKCMVTPKARIWHKIGKSTPLEMGIYYLTRNRFLFVRQHGTSLQCLSFLFYFWFRVFWFRSGVLLLYRKNIKAFFSFLRGTIDGFKILSRKTEVY